LGTRPERPGLEMLGDILFRSRDGKNTAVWMCFNMVTRNSESNRNLFLYGLMTFRFEISHVRTLTGQYHVTLMLLHVTILKHTTSPEDSNLFLL
jgi:hypothetical protein